jgi:hypothetical protein
MPFQNETAESKFRASFERLKEGRPQILAVGTAVSQNNVAKEAGADPSALRKSRYPALIREIQAWVELAEADAEHAKERRTKQLHAKESTNDRILRLTQQRDIAQSELVSIQNRILDVLTENAMLKTVIAELRPPPTKLHK